MNPDLISDLTELHGKYDGGLKSHVGAMTVEQRARFFQFRKDFLAEELAELGAAQTACDAVDATVDLVVVAIGTLDAFGVDTAEAWRRVHAANMAKVAGANPRRPNPFGLPDLLKPEGWAPPTHADNVGLLGSLFEGRG